MDTNAGEPPDANEPSDLVEARAARQLPEEAAAGSGDATAQAAAILEESEERTEAGAAGAVERRASEDTVTPLADE